MNMSKKNFIWLVALLATIVLVVGFLIEFSATPAKESEYKVAVLTPETGNLGFLGQSHRNVLTLAEEDATEKLKKANLKVRLIFADTQGNPKEALSQFTRLLDTEKINAVITTLSGVIGAINPLAKDKDVLFVALTPDPTFLATNPNGLRVLFSFDRQGTLVASAIKSKGAKQVLLLHSTDAATTYEVTKVLAPQLKADGVELSVDTLNVGQRDFKTLCAKYSDRKWESVIYYAFGTELPFLAEACAAHPNIAQAEKFGAIGVLDVKASMRPTLAGMKFFGPAFMAETDGTYTKFAKRYADRFPGQTFSYSSMYAYDAYFLIIESLLRKGVVPAKELKASLFQPTQALSQVYQFSPQGDVQPEMTPMEVLPDGTYKPIGK
jgi:ABC-type branched-subunit amino acid transport system substrate-binding protein